VSKRQGFLSLGLLTVFLLVMLYVVSIPTRLSSSAKTASEETIVISLVQGWNNLSLPLNLNLTASDLCALVPEMTDIYTFNSVWTGYYGCKKTAHVDYSLVPYKGYIVYLTAPQSFTLTGTRYPFSVYEWVLGPNYVGFDTSKQRLEAKKICAQKFTSPLEIISISRKPAEAAGNWSYWETYDCSSPTVPSFEIKQADAYFVTVQNPTKPEKTNSSPARLPNRI